MCVVDGVADVDFTVYGVDVQCVEAVARRGDERSRRSRSGFVAHALHAVFNPVEVSVVVTEVGSGAIFGEGDSGVDFERSEVDTRQRRSFEADGVAIPTAAVAEHPKVFFAIVGYALRLDANFDAVDDSVGGSVDF